MSIILTEARQAVWECIDKYEKTKDLYATKFKLEDDGSGRPPRAEPSPSDLNSIRIELDAVNPEWWLNQQMKVPFSLGVTIWTEHWDVCKAERYFELTNEAIWQYIRPGDGTVPRIARVTGYHPMGVTSVQWKRDTLNTSSGLTGQSMIPQTVRGNTGIEVTKVEYKLILAANRNPRVLQQS
jgi:hypothetical protein